MSKSQPIQAAGPTVGPKIIGGSPSAPIPSRTPRSRRQNRPLHERVFSRVEPREGGGVWMLRVLEKNGRVLQRWPLDEESARRLIADLQAHV